MYISFSSRPTSPDAEKTQAPVADAKKTRRVSSAVIAFGIVSMLTDISSESLTAVLPLYVTAYLGLSTIAFGIIDGLYQGVSAMVRIAGGYTSDRLDRPKWVAFSGYALAAAARVGLLFASGFTAMAAVISVDRIGKGIRTAPRDAVITAATRPEDLGTAFGAHRALDNIGAALGPLLAFVILLLIPDGYSTVFVASLAFAVVGVTVLGLFVPDVRSRPFTAAPARRTRKPRQRRERFDWSVVTSGRMRRVLASAGVLGLLSIGDGFVYLVLQSRTDFGAQWFPLLYVGTNVAFLALAVPLGRLADRIGRARVFVFGHVALLGAYLIAVLPVADALAIVLCLTCLGGFYAATDGVLAALAAELTTPTTRATGIAAAQTVVALSRFAAAAGFGVLWHVFGSTAAMLVVAAALVCAMPLVAFLLRPMLGTPKTRGGVDTTTEQSS